MREAWLYIAFPGTFENISSRKDKKAIRAGFGHLLPNGTTDNIDRDLLTIREALGKEAEPGFHFYRKPFIQQWKEPKDAKPKKQTGGNAPKAGPGLSTGDAPAVMASLEDLAASLMLEPADTLSRWAALLVEKGQVILQGPPAPARPSSLARWRSRSRARQTG